MEIEISPKTAEPFRLQFRDVRADMLRLIVLLLHSAVDDEHFGDDRRTKELVAKLDSAIGDLSPDVQDTLNMPE
jgi:hypothetical protein